MALARECGRSTGYLHNTRKCQGFSALRAAASKRRQTTPTVRQDQPDAATTVGTRQRKLHTQPRQQLRPGNPRRIVMTRPLASAVGRTGLFARRSFQLLADIPDRQAP